MKSIGTRFYVIVGLVSIFFSIVILYRSYYTTEEQVRAALLQQAKLALHFDLEIRHYVADNIRPRMYEFIGENEFEPETMSTSFVARSIFEGVRESFPDYILKFSSDNPRNPKNQAGPEELDMIQFFNENPDIVQWTCEINITGEPYMAYFNARRMKTSCLHCHGKPEDAPPSMIEQYGDQAGFNRPVGEIIALDTIAVPLSKFKKTLVKAMLDNTIFISTCFILLLITIILTFRFLIIKRLVTIRQHFQNTARKGTQTEIVPIPTSGQDEITFLTESFNELASHLGQIYNELDKRVSKRTKALSQVNADLAVSEEKYRSLFNVSIQKEKLTSLMLTLSNAVSITHDLDELFGFIHNTLLSIGLAKNMYIGLADFEKDCIDLKYYVDEYDIKSWKIMDVSNSRNNSPTIEVIRSGKPLLIHKDEILARIQDGSFYNFIEFI